MNSAQLIEKSKTLNGEKIALKQRLNELESEYTNNIQGLQDELRINTHKYTFQAEQDQTKIENYDLTIQNLEIFNKDVKSQLSSTENLYNQEKNITKTLSTRLEETSKANKENLEVLKSEDQKHLQKIDFLSKEKFELEKTIQNGTTRISTLEMQNSASKSEVELSQQETKRLRDKLSEYEEIIAMLRKSIESFIKGKDNEISRIKGILGTLEDKLLQTTADYETILTQNQELHLTLESISVLNYENRIQKLECELENSEKSKEGLQEQLKMSEQKLQYFIQGQVKEEMDRKIREYSNRYEQTKTELEKIVSQFEEQTGLLAHYEFENTDLKMKLSEYEEVNIRNESLREKLKMTLEEKYQLNEEVSGTRKQLFTTSKELLEKNKLAVEQNKTIKDLEQHIQALEDSLSTAFEDIKRLHLNIEEAKRAEEIADLPPVKKNDEIDQKLREIMIKTKVPVKFIRIGEGLYIFGSKRVHVKILNSKLVIRIGGGYMYVEEFIRLYAHQELAKLKNTKEDAPLPEVEPEEIPVEIKNPQPVQEEGVQGECLIRELEHLRGSDIKIIPNPSSNYDTTPIKKLSTDKTILPLEQIRPHNDTSKASISSDHNVQVSKDNVFYEITPKGGHGVNPGPKGTLNSQRTKTPDPKSHMHHEQALNSKLNDFESRRSSSKTPEIASTRESVLTARGTSRR